MGALLRRSVVWKETAEVKVSAERVAVLRDRVAVLQVIVLGQELELAELRGELEELAKVAVEWVKA